MGSKAIHYSSRKFLKFSNKFFAFFLKVKRLCFDECVSWSSIVLNKNKISTLHQDKDVNLHCMIPIWLYP